MSDRGGYDAYPASAAGLSAPLYGATIGQASGRFWRKYTVFTGRASRSEYWWWFLIALAVNVALKVIDISASGGYFQAQRTYGSAGDVLGYVWGLAIFIPSLAISIRRFHDTDRSGLFILLGLIPLLGTAIVLVLLASDSKPAGQRFD